MLLLWTITVGVLMFLGMICGVFVYFFRTGLNSKDSTTIDPPP